MEGEHANELNETYVSLSTIDNPPHTAAVESQDNSEEAKTPKPQNMYVGERLFNVELSVIVTPAGGKSIKIPFMIEKDLRGTMVEEFMEHAMNERLNLQILRAVLDNPKDRISVADAPTELQEKLF